MLKHEDNSETRVSQAAQVRVTPQELAAALAHLEARQGGLEGTIPLGDAVQELGLNTTPEELLREIEAGRARQQENQPRTRPPLSERLALTVVSALALVTFGGMLAFLRTVPPSPATATLTAAAPQAAPIGVPDTLLVQRRDHKMVLLSEVPDGQPVFCDLAGAETGATPAHFADFSPGPRHWTLVKHGGQVYVRGWVSDMSDTALRSTVVAVQPTIGYGNTGMRPVPVTLPLSSFQSSPGLTKEDTISAVHVVPDEHLKEKWQR